MTFEEWLNIKIPFPCEQEDWESLWNAAKAEGAREEREACADAVDELSNDENSPSFCLAIEYAIKAIRARGEGDPAPHP